jgi:hypothetical protein
MTCQGRAYRLALGITANAEDAENPIRTIDELPPHHRALIMRDVEDWSQRGKRPW